MDHLTHMASHSFVRVGRWQDALQVGTECPAATSGARPPQQGSHCPAHAPYPSDAFILAQSNVLALRAGSMGSHACLAGTYPDHDTAMAVFAASSAADLPHADVYARVMRELPR
jgi:hypothetical protein